MNVGKTLFAQVMEYVPWKNFGRIIERHNGDAGVRTLGCADLFRVMAFSQLTWRESLRDIEACLLSNQTKLFHMGLKGAPARTTLADALNNRDWCNLRSGDHPGRLLRVEGLPRAVAAHSIQRPRDGQNADFLDQQQDSATPDHRRAVQESLASGIVLQMDQAASAYQAFSGHERECG